MPTIKAIISAFLLILAIFFFTDAQAQDIRFFKHEIAALCAPAMAGRGYVRKGREHAAIHIRHRFQELGLLPFGDRNTYDQNYTFPVNTYPDTVTLKINGKALVPGVDFIIDAASPSFHTKKIKVAVVDVSAVKDAAEWSKIKASFSEKQRVYYFKGLDSMCRHLSLHPAHIAGELPKGAYIIPQHGKMNWDVATATNMATVFYVEDSVLPKKVRKAGIQVHSQPEAASRNTNIIGKVLGTAVPDSFIVISAHYDHLGMMGDDAVFPGASDNASGTAMMLYLASYYTAHPQRYSIIFIAFSGEEAGLLGSGYFVKHPTFPLSQIKFLVNVDIMGDATDGITVVNATVFPKEFSMLETLNKKGNYLTQIRSRGKAAISDHYPFSEAGVPAFFMYSNGGKGFYHDVFDKPATLSLYKIADVARLLQDFIGALQ